MNEIPALQNRGARGLEISTFLSGTAAALEHVLCAAENTRTSGTISSSGVFFFQTRVLRGFLGFRKAERVQNKMDYILCNEHKLSTENNLSGFLVHNQVTAFYALVSTPLTQGACFYQKYKI